MKRQQKVERCEQQCSAALEQAKSCREGGDMKNAEDWIIIYEIFREILQRINPYIII